MAQNTEKPALAATDPMIVGATAADAITPFGGAEVTTIASGNGEATVEKVDKLKKVRSYTIYGYCNR
jgi:hypothetical protein